jgi:hypothetical protein
MPNTFLKISMQSVGQEPAEWGKEIEKIVYWEIQEELNRIGKSAHELMINTIKSSIKREGSTGNLENSIQFQFWNTGFSCGFWIGDIDFLNANAKYWRWLNYGIAGTGRTTPPPNLGYFGGNRPPQMYGGTEKWTHTGSKDNYLMIPRKPIEAVNYIEKTISQLNIDIPAMLDRVDKELGK